jgi:hypothetical protein
MQGLNTISCEIFHTFYLIFFTKVRVLGRPMLSRCTFANVTTLQRVQKAPSSDGTYSKGVPQLSGSKVSRNHFKKRLFEEHLIEIYGRRGGYFLLQWFEIEPN